MYVFGWEGGTDDKREQEDEEIVGTIERRNKKIGGVEIIDGGVE